MDLTSFGPVVGQLLNAGSPAISTVLQMAIGEIPIIGGVAGPLAGMAAPRIISMIAGQLGVNDPDADTAAVAQKVVDTIQADPDAAKAKLASLEAEHTFALGMRDRDVAGQAQQVDLLKSDTQAGGLAALWRPLTALGIGFILALELLLPYVVWLATWVVQRGVPPALPEPRFDVTVALISGILGLGVLRTADKVTTASAVKAVAKAPTRR